MSRSVLFSYRYANWFVFLTSILLGLILQACASVYADAPSPAADLPTPVMRSLPAIQTEIPPELVFSRAAEPTAIQTPEVKMTPRPDNARRQSLNPAFPVLAGQHEYSFQTAHNGLLRYLMYLPTSYNVNRQWPLILYLHSSLEEGTDLSLLKQRALPEKLEQEPDFPFIVISPQISSGYWYQNIDSLEELLTASEAVLPIDLARLYLTGFSLGGYGTWAYAYEYPQRFAAIAPVAGSLDLGDEFVVPYDMCKLKSMPVWDFQGAQDTTVDPDEAQVLVKTLSNCGDEAKITLYPEAGHMVSGTLAYDDPALYDWFLAHQR